MRQKLDEKKRNTEHRTMVVITNNKPHTMEKFDDVNASYFPGIWMPPSLWIKTPETTVPAHGSIP